MLIRNLARKRQRANNQLYADDVFQSYVRTGTGAEQTITTNIDMTEGYMVWSKGRSGATDHAIYDSARGVTKDLVSNSTAAVTTQAQGLKSVSSTSHTWGTLTKVNTSASTYVDYVFRKAPKFFSLSTVTKSSGSDATVSFPDLATLGMVIVKRTDSTGSWYVWHRSLTAGKLLYLEQTAAEATLGHITVSGTTVTLENGVIADGTYIVYAYAHDTAEDGLIQCGSFTTDGSGNVPNVTLGWEPQYLLYKRSDGGAVNWYTIDSMRGFPVSGNASRLYPNLSVAEGVSSYEPIPTATGLTWLAGSYGANQTYIYMAIRRSNKPPTSGSDVYSTKTMGEDGGDTIKPAFRSGFPVDFSIFTRVQSGYTHSWEVQDRLRGLKTLSTEKTDAEVASDSTHTFDFNNGIHGYAALNTNYRTWMFKRAPGFFDNVCYTGTGVARTVNHNLGGVPELIIVKCRSNANDWAVYYGDNTDYMMLNSTAATADDATYWNDTTPTSTVFTVGTNTDVNQSTYTYVAYLFASLAGISKIGSYTGNGSTQNIDMGFSSGCRFFLVKASSTTGSWWVFDSTRGITAAADNALQLNSTAAEITTADAIDNYAAGITVNQETTCNINVNNATYIYLAIS